MKTEELVNRVGLALIAAGHALVGTAKFETKTETPKVEAANTPDPAPKEEKPKRKRRTKAEIAAEKAAKEAAPVEDDFEAEEVAEAEVVTQPTVDQDTLKKALVNYAKTNGKEKAFGILGKYGAKKVADLDPSAYGEVYDQVAVNA